MWQPGQRAIFEFTIVNGNLRGGLSDWIINQISMSFVIGVRYVFFSRSARLCWAGGRKYVRSYIVCEGSPSQGVNMYVFVVKC